MCKPKFNFHFCTCTSLNKKPLLLGDDEERDAPDYQKTHFIWTLYKFIGEKDNLKMGDMVMPAEKLDEELTSKYILQQLNAENHFDFDYSPSEGHNLKIRKEYIYKGIKGNPRTELYDYMSFIFRNGKWQKEFYDVFTDKLRKIKKGTVDRS